ncbi:MAG: MBL fold metallo-hydrolase [Chloroflexi bacterium]|nr:MBL fold metallo-hydrolase [Chloroflexota bacterium]
MKITQHGQYLWQLTRLQAFNCYLVDEGSELTLVDTNMSGSAADILKAAQSLGKPISRIVLTHAHGDHAGSLDAIHAQLPSAAVAFTARTAEFLQGNINLQPGEPQAKIRGGFVTCATPPTRLLKPDDTVGSLRVVAAPGHSPDLIAFWDERDGSLIAGDAFQTQAGIAVSGVRRWLFPFPAMATWHLPTAVQTAVTLRDLNPRRLAVGHGRVLENPGPQMTQAIHTAEAQIHG